MESEDLLPRSLVANLYYLIPVHIITAYFLKTYCNIIFPSTPTFNKWPFLSLPR